MAENRKKKQTIHSSAAEYLTFVASTGESDTSFEMRYEDENIGLTQKMMATLYDVSKQTISQHIKRIYADGELTPEARSCCKTETVLMWKTSQFKTSNALNVENSGGNFKKKG